MPSSTFYNLKPDRQRQIIDTAFKEFILNDYQSASLSRIIKELKLAKGSFYRYFESKKDLYFFLLKHSTDQRYETLEKRLQEPGMTLIQLITINWYDKMEFEMAHPLESAFHYRVFRERFNPELGDMEIRLKREIIEKTKLIIDRYYQQEVRKDIDPDLLAYHIMQTQTGMYDYLAIRFNDDLLENIKAGKPLYSLHKDEFMQLIKSFTNLLGKGISAKK